MAKLDTWLTDAGLTTLKGLARKGCSDTDIANAIGVSRSTFMLWKKNNKAISDAVRDGKLVADMNVENALYQRAIGYSYQEIKDTMYKDKETGELTVNKREVVTKHVAGDTTAQMFWLKNRRPDDWKDKVPEQGDQTENQLSSFFDALADSVKQNASQEDEPDDVKEDGDDNVT